VQNSACIAEISTKVTGALGEGGLLFSFHPVTLTLRRFVMQ